MNSIQKRSTALVSWTTEKRTLLVGKNVLVIKGGDYFIIIACRHEDWEVLQKEKISTLDEMYTFLNILVSCLYTQAYNIHKGLIA